MCPHCACLEHNGHNFVHQIEKVIYVKILLKIIYISYFWELLQLKFQNKELLSVFEGAKLKLKKTSFQVSETNKVREKLILEKKKCWLYIFQHITFNKIDIFF